MEPGAAANYLQWLSAIPSSRMRDAEPTLTDEGYIRMEWQWHGAHCIAELGNSYLYLYKIADNRDDDESIELDTFDRQVLNVFFARGTVAT